MKMALNFTCTNKKTKGKENCLALENKNFVDESSMTRFSRLYFSWVYEIAWD
jgi:hypothetical protein